MKSKWLTRILAVVICACTVMLVPMSDAVHAGYEKEDVLYTPDGTLSKYIEEHLPNGDYEMIESGNGFPVYFQMVDGEYISSVSGELAKDYGILQTRYYAYSNNESTGHFFLDISLSTDAVVTDKDRILIMFSCLTSSPPETSAALYLRSKLENWKWTSTVSVNNSLAPTDGDTFYLSGDSILNNGKTRRIFVHIPDVSLRSWDVDPYVQITWLQDMERLAELPVLQEQEDNSESLWKIVLISFILVFDVAMFVFFIKYIKKPQKEVSSQETTADSATEIAESEEEKELMKLSGDRKQEEIDYLKSIGYFKSKSSK